MAKKSNSPEVTKIVDNALASGAWHIERCKGHGKLRHSSGRMVVYASTVSDHRSSKNLARDIRHIEYGLPGRGEPNVITGVALKRKPGDNSLTC